MNPLLGLPDSLSSESYSPGYQSFSQMSGGSIGLPDSLQNESNGGSLTTVSDFANWHIKNWTLTQWAFIVVAGWAIAEVIKKKGF